MFTVQPVVSLSKVNPPPPCLRFTPTPQEILTSNQIITVGAVAYTLFNQTQYLYLYLCSIEHNNIKRNSNSPFYFAAVQSTKFYYFALFECCSIINKYRSNHYSSEFVYSIGCRRRDTSIQVQQRLYLNTNSIACRLPYWGGLLLCPLLRSAFLEYPNTVRGGKYDEIQNEIHGVKTSSGLVHIEILVVGDWRCRIGD